MATARSRSRRSEGEGGGRGWRTFRGTLLPLCDTQTALSRESFTPPLPLPLPLSLSLSPADTRPYSTLLTLLADDIPGWDRRLTRETNARDGEDGEDRRQCIGRVRETREDKGERIARPPWPPLLRWSLRVHVRVQKTGRKRGECASVDRRDFLPDPAWYACGFICLSLSLSLALSLSHRARVRALSCRNSTLLSRAFRTRGNGRLTRGSPIRHTARAIKKQLYAAPPQSRERRRVARNRVPGTFCQIRTAAKQNTVIATLIINKYVGWSVRSFVRLHAVRNIVNSNRDTLRHSRCVILIQRWYTGAS